ncbi:zinc finger and SCAN domain-containing protein 26-like [Lutzomyia longipalpis]|uniref:zinc finger and SCAN domain-containing protein 26-like n=1 Tax=Lutzomyia longipalpis TaxID=7200 RepID=UPI002484561E|nr:zinc finger and SCAN domain-containing protein 26-like [Lutzomyia longipalpis]
MDRVEDDGILLDYVIVKEEYEVQDYDQYESYEYITGDTSQDFKSTIETIENTNTSQYKCSICDKTFKKSFGLSHHKKIHIKSRNFLCAHCPKNFVSKRYLARHLQIHFETFSMECAICGKLYKTKNAFNAHMWRHLKRSHQCGICKKDFSTTSHVKRHIREVHEKINSIRWYQCGICEKNFTTSSHVKRHIREVHEKVKRRSEFISRKKLKKIEIKYEDEN